MVSLLVSSVSVSMCRDAKSVERRVEYGSMVFSCAVMRALCSVWRAVMAARAVLAFVFLFVFAFEGEVTGSCLRLPLQAEVRVRRLTTRRRMRWKKCILTIGLNW